MKRQRQAALEADFKRDAEQREKDQEIEVEKQKLMDEFEAWQTHLYLPEQTPAKECQNRIDRAQRVKDAHRSTWITASHAYLAKNPSSGLTLVNHTLCLLFLLF